MNPYIKNIRILIPLLWGLFSIACGGGGGGSNPTPPSPLTQVNISDAVLNEGDSGLATMTFNLGLSTITASDVILDYSTSNDTALAGEDYVAASGSLTIPAGQIAATIEVAINGDTDVEADQSFTLSLSNLSGNAAFGVSTATGTILNDDTVPPPVVNVTRYMYVLNTDSTLSIYAADSVSGQLRSRGYLSIDTGFIDAVVDPQGQYAFLLGDTGVVSYAIAADGMFTQVTGTPLAGATNPIAMTVDYTGRFLFVADETAKEIWVYAIDRTTGTLTVVGGSPFNSTFLTGLFRDIAVDPTGNFLYVAYVGGVLAFTIDTTTGALTSSSRISVVGAVPTSIMVDPNGKFVYFTDSNAGNVQGFAIDVSSGGLSSLGAAVPVGLYPNSIAADPGGHYVYVANRNSNDLSAFTLDPISGLLTQIDCGSGPDCNGVNFNAGTQPEVVTIDYTGQIAYVANRLSNDVTVYSIDPVSGALTMIDAIKTHGIPKSIGIANGIAAVSYRSTYAYNVNLDDRTVSSYDINDATGELSNFQTLAVADDPFFIAAHPNGRFVYSANLDGIYAYTVDPSSGELSIVSGSPFSAGLLPLSLTIDPSGRFIYVIYGLQGNIYAYTIDTTSGALVSISGSPYATTSPPDNVVIEPSGRFVYALVSSLGEYSIFDINKETGALVQLDCGGGTGCDSFHPENFTTGVSTRYLTVDPAGKFVYMLNVNGIATYRINSEAGVPGTLALQTTTPYLGGNDADTVTLHPWGKFAYTVNRSNSELVAYQINRLTGEFAPIVGSPRILSETPYVGNIDISGTYFYIVNRDASSVSTFFIRPATGRLVEITDSPFSTGLTPNALTTVGLIE